MKDILPHVLLITAKGVYGSESGRKVIMLEPCPNGPTKTTTWKLGWRIGEVERSGTDS